MASSATWKIDREGCHCGFDNVSSAERTCWIACGKSPSTNSAGSWRRPPPGGGTRPRPNAVVAVLTAPALRVRPAVACSVCAVRGAVRAMGAIARSAHKLISAYNHSASAERTCWIACGKSPSTNSPSCADAVPRVGAPRRVGSNRAGAARLGGVGARRPEAEHEGGGHAPTRRRRSRECSRLTWSQSATSEQA